MVTRLAYAHFGLDLPERLAQARPTEAQADLPLDGDDAAS
jgi:hypothetical protein